MPSIINATTTAGVAVTGDNSGALALQTNNGTTAVTIDTSQNVGIGTASPAAKLTVASGGKGRFYRADNTRYGDIYTDNDAFKIESSVDPIIINAATGQGIRFQDAGTERMRIASGGQLLVGTTTASNTFVVSNASGGNAVAQIINTTSSGNVIGFASTLQSNGNNTSSAHFQGNTNSVGNWYLFGNGTTSYSSDERLKKNIETTRDGYLEDLCKLRVVKYNWKLDEEGKNKELGLIAQEVEKVFPNLVQDDLKPISQDDDTIYKQLKQSVLPFMLLKAIQELNAKVEAQAVRIAELESKIMPTQEQLDAVTGA
jgi:hypothetical protein